MFTTGSAKNAWGLFTSSGLYPTAIDSGQYSFLGWTYGYIQDKDYTVYANKGQIADMKINLLIGVNITLDILFKKEHLISGTPYNMSARVRVFDDSGNLVATWMSSEGVYVTAQAEPDSGTDLGNYAADGNRQYPFDEGLNYLPGGVNLLHVQMAGLPEAPEWAFGYGPTLEQHMVIQSSHPAQATSKLTNGQLITGPLLTHTSRTKVSSDNPTIQVLVGLLR